MTLFGSTAGIFLVILIIVLVVLFSFAGYKKYTTRSKEVSVLVDIMTILIGIASIFATFVSIDVMRSQEKLQEILLDIQKKENQPVFYVRQSLSKTTSDGIYDIEDYSIESFGGYMASPAKIEHKTFINFQYTGNNEQTNVELYIPVLYHNAYIEYDNIIGILYKTYGNEDLKNIQYFNDIYKAVIEHYKSIPGYADIKKIELFKISYIDIYGDNRTVYYLNSHKIDKTIYDKIENYEKKYLYMKKEIDKLTFDDILNIIESLK